jgi:hypothetical protein
MKERQPTNFLDDMCLQFAKLPPSKLGDDKLIVLDLVVFNVFHTVPIKVPFFLPQSFVLVILMPMIHQN